MAKLPQLIAEGRLPAKAAAVGIERPDLYGTGAARGLNAFGNALESAGLTVAAVEKNARDTRDVIAGNADATEELDRYRVELDSDPDYKGREAKFRARADAVRARLGEKMSNAAALDFEKSFERSYSVMAHSLRDRARKDEIEEHAVKLDESNNKILDVALRERDPRKRALHLEQIATNIEQARAANILSKSQADRYHTATLEKFERLQIADLQRTNPAAALRLLTAEGDKGGLKYMDPLAKRELALRVQRDMEHRAALASAATRATVGEVVSLLDNGVKPEKLDEARRLAKGNKKLTDALDEAEGGYHATLQYRALDFTERRQATSAILEKEATTGLTGAETRLLSRYAAAEKQILDAYSRDPMAAAMERNGPAALALADAEKAGDPIRFRAALDTLAETQAKDGGVRPYAMKLLPKQAETAIEAQLAGPSNQAQLDTIQRLQQFYGPERMPRVMAQLDNGKLPGHVKVLAALGPKQAGDPDTKRILDAAKVPNADWAKIFPEEDTRKSLRDAVGVAGADIRAAFAKMPGGNQRFADFARSAEDVAFSLLADKSAADPKAAAKQAWDIVHNHHFALAGTVAIPKVGGQPIADPRAISAYQDYVRANLDKFNIAPPPPTPATRMLTADQRREQYIRHLRTFGTFVSTGDDRGMLLLDGNGVAVPLATAGGDYLRADFDAITKNPAFKGWRSGSNDVSDPAERRRLGLPANPADEVLRLRINRPNKAPGDGGDSGDENFGGGGQAFNPEGRGYDYDAARSAGMGPDGTGDNKGHWGSVREATADERRKHNLPDEAYLLLKGRQHETWDKAVKGEAERGFKIIKRGGRYWSVPQSSAD